MLHNNCINQRKRNLRKFLMNFIKSETPVRPDLLITPLFQVLIDEGWASGLFLVVKVCPALVKNSTAFSHI